MFSNFFEVTKGQNLGVMKSFSKCELYVRNLTKILPTSPGRVSLSVIIFTSLAMVVWSFTPKTCYYVKENAVSRSICSVQAGKSSLHCQPLGKYPTLESYIKLDIMFLLLVAAPLPLQPGN